MDLVRRLVGAARERQVRVIARCLRDDGSAVEIDRVSRQFNAVLVEIPARYRVVEHQFRAGAGAGVVGGLPRFRGRSTRVVGDEIQLRRAGDGDGFAEGDGEFQFVAGHVFAVAAVGGGDLNIRNGGGGRGADFEDAGKGEDREDLCGDVTLAVVECARPPGGSCRSRLPGAVTVSSQRLAALISKGRAVIKRSGPDSEGVGWVDGAAVLVSGICLAVAVPVVVVEIVVVVGDLGAIEPVDGHAGVRRGIGRVRMIPGVDGRRRAQNLENAGMVPDRRVAVLADFRLNEAVVFRDVGCGGVPRFLHHHQQTELIAGAQTGRDEWPVARNFGLCLGGCRRGQQRGEGEEERRHRTGRHGTKG